MNSLSFCLPEKSVCRSFSKDDFTGCRILGEWIFCFKHSFKCFTLVLLAWFLMRSLWLFLFFLFYIFGKKNHPSGFFFDFLFLGSIFCISLNKIWLNFCFVFLIYSAWYSLIFLVWRLILILQSCWSLYFKYSFFILSLSLSFLY